MWLQKVLHALLLAFGMMLAGLTTAVADPDDGFPLFGGDNDFPGKVTGRALLGGDDGFPILATEAGKAVAPANELKACSLIDFDKWDVREGFVAGTWFLTVWGKLPAASIRVQLMPVLYVRKPKHWEIQVVGCVPPVVPPVTGEFIETISITSFMGTKGIKIVGATRVEEWDKDEAE